MGFRGDGGVAGGFVAYNRRRGDDLFAEGKFDAAAAAYEQALAFDPADVSLEIRRIDAWLGSGRIERAYRALSAELRSIPGDRGWSALRRVAPRQIALLKKYNPALRVRLESGKTDMEPLLLGYLDLRSGRSEEGRRHLEEAIQRSPELFAPLEAWLSEWPNASDVGSHGLPGSAVAGVPHPKAPSDAGWSG